MFSHALATIIYCYLSLLVEFLQGSRTFHFRSPPTITPSDNTILRVERDTFIFLLKKLTYHLSAPSLHEKFCPTLSYPTHSTFDFIRNPAFGTSSRTPVIHIHLHSHSLRAHCHSHPYFRFGRPAPLYFLVRPAWKGVPNVCAPYPPNPLSPRLDLI